VAFSGHKRGRVTYLKRLRVFVVCLTLEIGVLSGVPMRPDEIEELMDQMNQPTMAHALPAEGNEGDGEPR
jgi:hypothetical protein